MHIDWWTLALQTINLVILIGLLGRFLFRPMAAMVAARQAEAARLLDEAAAAKAAATAARDAVTADHAAIDRARAEVLAAARTEAEAQRTALLAEAEATIRQHQADADTVAQRQRDEARRQLDQSAHALAIDVAARLLQTGAARLVIAPFLPDLEAALAEVPAPARAALAAGALTLTTAQAPAPGDAAAIAAVLDRALGQAPALTMAVDPALIAGLRLDGAMTAIDVSLRAGLTRIAAELDRHD